ncbi:DMT family transporter [Sneathiella aquimaris]|uniref:DMT family transporter n=1 Tax=Sneathiella aquimaris TaxID=2599305 RepID=UPI00146F0F99|nr:DMT family transporter [Sneathiella aquimaris]
MNNIRGTLFMVLAMAAFALEDMFFKSAVQAIPVGQALILFGLGGMLVFMILSMAKGEKIIHPQITAPPLIIRSACELLGRLFFALAIAYTPLSSASAILQATPLFVALGAIFFFKESVGWHRWGGIILGFAGVLLILRPGWSGFEAASLFAVLGTLGFAGRDLATRAAPMTMSNRQLGIYGFFILFLAGVILSVWHGISFVVPEMTVWFKLSATIAAGVVAYNALTIAMRTGEISVVAPFRYTRLVFAMILGAIVFSERPDGLTLLGSAIVVASGCYIVLRERKTRKQ